MGRRLFYYRDGLYKGPWTPDEDFLLIKYIQAHGVGRWRSVPKKAGLNRCGKSCRFRWMNYLRPGIKRGDISAEEEELIIKLHSLVGNRWSLIARRMPGRTDNEVKNYWNTHLRKRFKKSTDNEVTNEVVDENHMINHNSISTISHGVSDTSNNMPCMEAYNTAMVSAHYESSEAVGNEGWNHQTAHNSGIESSSSLNQLSTINQFSSCISSYKLACDQSLMGMDWSVGDLQALLSGYDLGTAHAFLT
ncbi:hypothetical protein SUGI_0415470 [Cryptomeria japonica]|uniref:transcription factor WER n=1 Tax=Cryptomeria japonica TaxID=3369 RepID=UPI0024089675|nr:transcription factor WER [Cryptomeria japonica]GLJ22135.1 hypothetical protein SUGI_0415470 [Cryptomeria japonica]